jgi:hypothetical protein
MPVKFLTAFIGSLLVLLPATVTSCPAQTAKSQIEGKLNELKQTVNRMQLDESQSQGYKRLIGRTETALQSDFLHLGLVYLQQAWMNIQPDAFSLAKAEMAKQGMAGFDAEWKKVGAELKDKAHLLNGKSTVRAPMLVNALFESALSQTQPYHQSSRLYALNADVGEALIYLGRAKAALEFALFCKTLQLPVKGDEIGIGSLDAELAELENRMVAAYKQPDAAAKQSVFIQISVTFKVAEELNRDKRYAGALMKYLDALLELTIQTTPAPDEEKLKSLKTQSESFIQRFAASASDLSIGSTYASMAAFLLKQNNADAVSQKRAAAIIETIIPAYLKITAKEK